MAHPFTNASVSTNAIRKSPFCLNAQAIFTRINPVRIIMKQGILFLLNGILGIPNQPKWSMTAEMTSCPVTDKQVITETPRTPIQ